MIHGSTKTSATEAPGIGPASRGAALVVAAGGPPGPTHRHGAAADAGRDLVSGDPWGAHEMEKPGKICGKYGGNMENMRKICGNIVKCGGKLDFGWILDGF